MVNGVTALFAAGYFVGVLAGRSIFLDQFRQISAVWIFLGIASAWLVVINRPRIARLFSPIRSTSVASTPLFLPLFLGILWGGYWCGPQPVPKETGVVLRRSSHQAEILAPALMRGSDGHIYELNGTRAREGEKIAVRYTLGHQLFSKTRAQGVILEPLTSGESENVFLSLVENSRREILARCDGYGPILGGWLKAMVVGIISNPSAIVLRSFRETGLLHLLVVSGAHVSMLCVGIGFVCTFPLRVLYALRLIGPNQWPYYSALCKVVSMGGAITFGFIAGETFASQRAVIAFCVFTFSQLLIGEQPISRRLLVTLFLQILIYPVGFVCESALMSWLAYLSVAAFAGQNSSRFATPWQRVRYGLTCQMQLSIMMGAITGTWCLWGILVNFVAAPVIGVVFGSSILLLLPEFLPEWVLIFSQKVQEVFINSVVFAADLGRSLKLTMVALPPKFWVGRCLLLLLAAVLAFNSAANLSIRGVGRQERA